MQRPLAWHSLHARRSAGLFLSSEGNDPTPSQLEQRLVPEHASQVSVFISLFGEGGCNWVEEYAVAT
ncbi:hypothetical protein PLANPX_1188 [Lacipirellula parvula]|uniref:Uncharacterized protein n=1 Tax=Lacipirellula parvula TaxID=2650471 RepID=A0A5K7XB47_9BACT|nr:hypothetical protein PLANPX_1188 [Lacipirellula parvula]